MMLRIKACLKTSKTEWSDSLLSV